jgi:hypothetical protein
VITGAPQDSDVSACTLFSSGLIAGDLLCGILFAVLVGTNHIKGPQSIGDMLPFLHDGRSGYIAGVLLFSRVYIGKRERDRHERGLVRRLVRDTVERLASRMALIDRQLDRFRVLNGLDANERLQPGDLVKIIVE